MESMFVLLNHLQPKMWQVGARDSDMSHCTATLLWPGTQRKLLFPEHWPWEQYLKRGKNVGSLTEKISY